MRKCCLILNMGDILNVSSSWLNIPRSAKGYGNNDFLWFKVDTPDVVPSSLFVFLKDSSEDYQARCLGRLQPYMKVPNIYYPPYATLTITGRNRKGEKVEFRGRMQRGSMYNVTTGVPGIHRIYPVTTTENCGCCNYSTAY